MERLFSEFNLDEDESDWSPVMLSESQLPEITTPAEDNEEAPKSPSRRKLSGDNMSMTDLTSNPAKLNIANNNAQTSPLLRLPPELRNKIYAFVFSGYEYSWTSTEIRDSETFNPIEGQHRTHLLSLTLACRQTYTETVLLFFKYNTLFIANDVNFEKWLAQTLLPAQIAAIEKVACMAEHAGHCFGRGDASCFTKFHEFKALKFVILRSRQLSMCGLVGLRPGRRRLVEGVKEANREKELEVIIEELVRTQWVMKCWINVGRPWCR